MSASKRELLAKVGRFEIRSNIIGEIVVIDMENYNKGSDEAVIRMNAQEACDLAAVLGGERIRGMAAVMPPRRGATS